MNKYIKGWTQNERPCGECADCGPHKRKGIGVCEYNDARPVKVLLGERMWCPGGRGCFTEKEQGA